jgi:pyruvate formate lyase activating enzyme
MTEDTRKVESPLAVRSAPLGLRTTHHPRITDPLDLPGFVHSVERGATVDGPGVRYLIFLAGCAFRCLYCHNPDTWKAYSHQKKSLGEVLDDVGKYLPYIQRRGGVTVSGGEPLGQATFVKAFFEELKDRWGLHTALDTQGNLGSRLDDAWFDPVDLLLLDIKHMDDEKHRALTAFPVAPTLEFAQRMSRLGKQMWIRHVVVPGWTDGLDHAARLADFVATLETVTRVELLPFHQMGTHKWKELNLEYKLADTLPPTAEALEALKAVFRERGLTVP